MSEIRITCLIDNLIVQDSRLFAEHGLSIHIETSDGRILFDTGQSGKILSHNARMLGIDLAQIDALVISHAHYDHTGGLRRILQSIGLRIPLYAHPDIFRPRFSMKQGAYQSIGLGVTREDLEEKLTVSLSSVPEQVLPNVWTTGGIVERPYFEGRSAHHFVRSNGTHRPDPYQDDMSLVIETEGGLVVICGCCHAGLLNTLRHVRNVFGREITAVIGGFHLISASDAEIETAIEELRTHYHTPRLYPGHCTGERAMIALTRAFGDVVCTLRAGLRIDLENETSSRNGRWSLAAV